MKTTRFQGKRMRGERARAAEFRFSTTGANSGIRQTSPLASTWPSSIHAAEIRPAPSHWSEGSEAEWAGSRFRMCLLMSSHSQLSFGQTAQTRPGPPGSASI